MLAKYPGTCIYCNKPTKAGDQYDPERRESYHLDCHESQPPDPADYEKAESLGFRAYDELMKELDDTFGIH